MAFALMVAVVAVVALLTGGRIRYLNRIRFKFAWLVVIALLIKVVTYTDLRSVLGVSDFVWSKFYIGSLVLVALFVILNINLRGLVLVGLGLVGNLTTIIANGGNMPVKSEYVPLIATPEEVEMLNQGAALFNYVATGPDTKFYYLSDVFLMPDWVYFSKVFSIGDVLITIGGAIFVWTYLKAKPKTINYPIQYLR